MSFGVPTPDIDWATAPHAQSTELAFHLLKGSFIHTLLEWTAVCTATLTAILALLHFRIREDVTVPVLGMALFASGCVDAFHTLTTDRLFHFVVASNETLIPFTWAISRVFNSLVKVVGIALLLLISEERKKKFKFGFVIVASLGLIMTSAAVILFCAQSQSLPTTMFPNSLISRPYDLVSMVFYGAATVLFWKNYRDSPSYFTHALFIGLVPDLVTQAHMAFGSRVLFDNDFFVGHAAKAVSYFVPFCGICLDYVRTYRQLDENLHELRNTQDALLQTSKMTALGEMAGGVAHEINNPLALIKLNAGQMTDLLDDEPLDKAFLRKSLGNIEHVADRISKIVYGLRCFARNESKDSFQPVAVRQLILDTLLLCADRFKQSQIDIQVEAFPADLTIEGRPVEISQVLVNLLNNAHDAVSALPQRWVKIGFRKSDGFVDLTVTDSGPGIPPEVRNKIFQPFFTTKSCGKGTGIGLSISIRIVQEHHGKLSIDDSCSNTCFVLRLPVRQDQAPRMAA